MSGRSILRLSTIKELWQIILLLISVISYSSIIVMIGEKIRERYFYPFVIAVGILIVFSAIYLYKQKEDNRRLKDKLKEIITNTNAPAIIAAYHVEKESNGLHRCTVVVNLKKDLFREKKEIINEDDLSLTKVRIITNFELTELSGIKLIDSDGKYFEYKLDANPNSIIDTCIFSFTVSNTPQRHIFLKIFHHPTNETYNLNIVL